MLIEVLAAIAADPTSAPLFLVAALALGMYPVGFMLGGNCSPCCRCDVCTEGELPETVTVTLGGFTDKQKSPPLCTLSFSSCFGSGAAGEVTAPGGYADVDQGPISSVALTNKGSGYALLGREQPTVTVADVSGAGSGAAFSVTLAESKNDCGIPQWGVGTVAVSGGVGYADGDRVFFQHAAGDTEEQEAVAYIREERFPPTLSASAPNGAGAAFSITYERSPSSPFVWSIKSVAVLNGGAGYTDGDSLTLSLGAGDVQLAPATATITTPPGPPTLAASAAGGSGAAFSISYLPQPSPLEGWFSVSSVAVTNGGAGYSDNAAVAFTLGASDVLLAPYLPAFGTARTVLRAPADSWSLFVEDWNAGTPSAGSGLQLSIALSQFTYSGRPAWKASSATVVAGGAGYAAGEVAQATATEGDSPSPALFEILSVDGSGAVLSVAVLYDGGRYSVDTGVIESVTIGGGGVYRKESGAIGSVVVTDGGEYYKQGGAGLVVAIDNPGAYFRENPSLPPYVAEVSVAVDQSPPSDGSGASISAEVDSDPESPHFGSIVSLSIDGGGSNYLAWVWQEKHCCGWYLNGESIVLKRFEQPEGESGASATIAGAVVGRVCTYSHEFCGGYKSPFSPATPEVVPPIPMHSGRLRIEVGYRGPDFPPVAHITSGFIGAGGAGQACHAAWVGNESLSDCTAFEWSAEDTQGRTISVVAGGEYDPAYRFSEHDADDGEKYLNCLACCQGEEETPQEITVSVNKVGAIGYVPGPWGTPSLESGSYVLQRGYALATHMPLWWHPGGGTANSQIWVQIVQYPCANPWNTDCDHCIQKCAVGFSIGGYITPGTLLFDFASNLNCGGDPCISSACLPTPLCKPPAGASATLGVCGGGQVLDGENYYAVTVTDS